MKMKQREQTKSKKRRWIGFPWIAVIIAVLLVLIIAILCPYPWDKILQSMQTLGDEAVFQNDSFTDDQRSTLWPLLISIVATMLGSLITSYIFLKDALDRTADEKPYYDEVIGQYRNQIVYWLWIYTLLALFAMGAGIGLFFLFYYVHWRSHNVIRSILIALCLAICTIGSVFILRKCLYISKGLYKTAERLLENKSLEIQKLAEPLNMVLQEIIPMLDQSISAATADKSLTVMELAKWLQINSDSQSEHAKAYLLSKDKFINRFSEWEKLLLLLLEQDIGESASAKAQPMYQRIQIAMQKLPDIPDGTIERNDADSNRWRDDIYEKLHVCEQILEKKPPDLATDFSQIFRLLSDCRNLFLVQKETGCHEEEWINADKIKIAELFACLLLYMSVEVFRAIPRVRVFIPAEQFWYANFYNTRFEDSAFRASSFRYSVFARSKITNSNFNMTKFVNCEFYSVDCRNCSFSNSILIDSALKEAIYVDVDFTGTELEQCRLERTKFQDSILSNMVLVDVSFGIGGNDFTNSKISNIKIMIHDSEYKIVKSNFTNCSLHDIQICILPTPPLQKEDSRSEDPLVRDCLAFCQQLRLQQFFWDEGGRKQLNIRNMVTLFVPNTSEIEFTKIECKNELKYPEKKSIWKVISRMSAVFLQESVFENAEMPQFHFYRADLTQCVFRNAVMNEVTMIGVTMTGSIMTGANLRKGIFCAVDMSSCVLTDAILYDAVCRLINYEDAALAHLHASSADFACCSFNRSDCTGIDLTSAALTHCSFMDTILTGAELTGARFDHVNFRNSIADKMLSSYSLFHDCDLTNSLLSQSCLNDTVFKKCNFELANFKSSTVVNAEFHRCDFRDSNFENTCFIHACFQDSKNLDVNIFKGARFIRTRFMGEDIGFPQKLRAAGIDIQD